MEEASGVNIHDSTISEIGAIYWCDNNVESIFMRAEAGILRPVS